MKLCLLSFDTSGPGLSVSISRGGEVLAQSDHDSDGPEKADRPKADRQESVSMLMPTIDTLVRQAGLAKKELQAIAVGVGPGGFTGVRVAVVTGRTLAQALKLPLVPVNSLEVMSYDLPSAEAGGVIKEASKSHCFVARYEAVAGAHDLHDLHNLRTVQAPTYLTTEALSSVFEKEPETIWYLEERLLDRFPQYAQRLRPLPSVNNIAVSQAKIAHVRLSLKADEGQDLLAAFPYQTVQPLYLRGASVTLKKGDVIERVETH